jgi:uncharacterized protein YndB with AHSA1/START domain
MIRPGELKIATRGDRELVMTRDFDAPPPRLRRSHQAMGMGGVYREIVKPERIVATERFDESWYPGEALTMIVLTEQGTMTLLTQTMRYESRAARDAVLKSDMERGVKASYDRLAEVLASIPE